MIRQSDCSDGDIIKYDNEYWFCSGDYLVRLGQEPIGWESHVDRVVRRGNAPVELVKNVTPTKHTPLERKPIPGEFYRIPDGVPGTQRVVYYMLNNKDSLCVYVPPGADMYVRDEVGNIHDHRPFFERSGRTSFRAILGDFVPPVIDARVDETPSTDFKFSPGSVLGSFFSLNASRDKPEPPKPVNVVGKPAHLEAMQPGDMFGNDGTVYMVEKVESGGVYAFMVVFDGDVYPNGTSSSLFSKQAWDTRTQQFIYQGRVPNATCYPPWSGSKLQRGDVISAGGQLFLVLGNGRKRTLTTGVGTTSPYQVEGFYSYCGRLFSDEVANQCAPKLAKFWDSQKRPTVGEGLDSTDKRLRAGDLLNWQSLLSYGPGMRQYLYVGPGPIVLPLNNSYVNKPTQISDCHLTYLGSLPKAEIPAYAKEILACRNLQEGRLYGIAASAAAVRRKEICVGLFTDSRMRVLIPLSTDNAVAIGTVIPTSSAALYFDLGPLYSDAAEDIINPGARAARLRAAEDAKAKKITDEVRALKKMAQENMETHLPTAEVWVSRSGRVTPINKLVDQHLKNIIAKLKRDVSGIIQSANESVQKAQATMGKLFQLEYMNSMPTIELKGFDVKQVTEMLLSQGCPRVARTAGGSREAQHQRLSRNAQKERGPSWGPFLAFTPWRFTSRHHRRPVDASAS